MRGRIATGISWRSIPGCLRGRLGTAPFKFVFIAVNSTGACAIAEQTAGVQRDAACYANIVTGS